MSIVLKRHLANAQSVNKALKTLTEEQLKHLLAYEKAHDNRMSIVLRLYGRYNLLRAKRERAQLLGSTSDNQTHSG